MRKSLEQVLINRDKVTDTEAKEQVERFREWFDNAIERGAGLMEIEEAFEGDFGLEPDYLDEFLY